LPTITEQPTPLVPQRRQDTFGESIRVGRLVDVNRVFCRPIVQLLNIYILIFLSIKVTERSTKCGIRT